jgi:hypothetical protein
VHRCSTSSQAFRERSGAARRGAGAVRTEFFNREKDDARAILSSFLPCSRDGPGRDLSALKLGGVGVSGIALNRFSGEGFATYEQTVFNNSDEPAFLTVDYAIPNLEVAVWAGASIIRGPAAFARAAFEVTVKQCGFF